METIRRLIAKLDVDIYGGQRVFIYFAENTKARDLATTLDAIYGRGDRGPAITGTQQPQRTLSSISSPSSPSGALPPPAVPAARSGAHRGQPGARPAVGVPGRLGRGRAARGGDPLRRRRGDQRDHRHHLSAALEGDRGDDQEARQDAAPGADRGAGRRGHADRRHQARHRVGGALGPLRRELVAVGPAARPPGPVAHPPGRRGPARASTSSRSRRTSSWPRSTRSPARTGSTCCRTRPS